MEIYFERFANVLKFCLITRTQIMPSQVNQLVEIDVRDFFLSRLLAILLHQTKPERLK